MACTPLPQGRLLAHRWIYKGYPGSFEVTFALFKQADPTRLKPAHSGLASSPGDPHFSSSKFEDGYKQIPGSNLTPPSQKGPDKRFFKVYIYMLFARIEHLPQHQLDPIFQPGFHKDF